ncbi:mannose-1-phosphate guanylyltransferase [Deinococcus peraridilitoris]|uniref:mannose-1-phosphate guanylyltransferase n=1 Tax=Deinococcus peraridilitoris (strain DSM 19664 / LMG 22246 / CIP 109416 / KR-200) TaxID=937777 RepID=L0A6Q0_DEIPD|nr:mannose-1-phosphate guanylyltransferase [Deinococcus peraridilitoris]AFZ69521.1 mannose-1-phosphate guanylyltransferase [Deinococcus peraridilitoris DSM 19664]
MSPVFYPVILAGGSGERFWPLSRRAKPKQFLTLDTSGESLLQATARRLSGINGSLDNLYVITSGEYRSQVLDQLPDLSIENLIVEPVARDTAPAVLYAALRIAQHDPNGVMGVFPADHRITDTQGFHRVIERARHAAEMYDSLVTLGITPTFPSTGYGYIENGDRVEDGEFPINTVTCFREKPDRGTAEEFLQQGHYCWNSGMFVWKVDSILNAYRELQPPMYQALSEALQSRGKVREVFPALEKISIDYAILERAKNVQIIPANFGWDDLGDWNALERLLRGVGSNVAVGRHVGLDTDGAILYTTNSDDLIATIGLEDVVVIRTPDITLVVRKDRTQDIKQVVKRLKEHPELVRFA